MTGVNWRTTLQGATRCCFPWLAFFFLLWWLIGNRHLMTTLPHYGDTLETAFGVTWLDESIRGAHSLLVYPLNYFPEGWRVASHSMGIPYYALLWPFYRLGGAALAVNAALLLGALVAFAGAYLVARFYFNPWLATVPALAFAFWGFRWQQVMDGHLNIFLGSALLPWIVWGIERSLRADRHRAWWLLTAASIWALAFMITQYYAFVGGFLVIVWFALIPVGTRQTRHARLRQLATVCGMFFLLSLPWLWLAMRETAIADPPFYHFGEVAIGGISLNSLPLPFMYHPLLGTWTQTIFHGRGWEQDVANLGLSTALLTIAGVILALKRRPWYPILAMTVLFLVVATGLILLWSGRPVTVPALQSLNEWLWRLGHAIKPEFFSAAPPDGAMVPLPSLLLAIFVPFFERGRLLARYFLPAGLGFFLLATLAISVVRYRWLQVALGILLVFEIMPPQLETVPFPPVGHPAFAWLQSQSLNDQGIVETYAGNPATLVIAIQGDTLLATRYHHQPTAAGSAGVVPRHTAFLANWLAAHQHTFWQPDFAQILRDFKIKYILVQMRGEEEQRLWQEAQVATDVKALNCFPAPSLPSPWPWPICIVEVPPAPSPDFNVLWGDGWSGREAWGVWAEGIESQAQWIATARAPQRLSISAFPNCRLDRFQRIELEVNGTLVGTHQWQDCEPWETEIDVPVELVRVGANDLVVRSAYASPPPNAADPRQLSVGVTKLLVAPEQSGGSNLN